MAIMQTLLIAVLAMQPVLCVVATPLHAPLAQLETIFTLTPVELALVDSSHTKLPECVGIVLCTA